MAMKQSLLSFEDRVKSLTSKIQEIFQDLNQLNPFYLYINYFLITFFERKMQDYEERKEDIPTKIKLYGLIKFVFFLLFYNTLYRKRLYSSSTRHSWGFSAANAN
jgi:hypothetical protein